MIQEYISMRIRVEDRRNVIRRKSDGKTFGKGLCIQLKDDSPENYEEIPMREAAVEGENNDTPQQGQE